MHHAKLPSHNSRRYVPLVPRVQSSGVQCQPDCLTEFEKMKIRSEYKV